MASCCLTQAGPRFCTNATHSQTEWAVAQAARVAAWTAWPCINAPAVCCRRGASATPSPSDHWRLDHARRSNGRRRLDRMEHYLRRIAHSSPGLVVRSVPRSQEAVRPDSRGTEVRPWREFYVSKSADAGGGANWSRRIDETFNSRGRRY